MKGCGVRRNGGEGVGRTWSVDRKVVGLELIGGRVRREAVGHAVRSEMQNLDSLS